MRSKAVKTYQIEDYAAGAAELLEAATTDFFLQKNSIGFLFLYSDMDTATFVGEISAHAGFPIVGATCIAAIDSTNKSDPLCATLLLLTADDCEFSVGVSEPVTAVNLATETARAYQQAAEGLPEPARLIYALPPYDLFSMLDEYADLFNELAPGVPVLGGLPSHSSLDSLNATICKGRIYPNRLVVVAFSGNMRPVFSVQNVTGTSSERKRKVTHSEDNVIYRVGDKTFTDYLAEVGLPLDNLDAGSPTVTFVTNPLLLENVSIEGKGEYSFARSLHKVDPAIGSGTSIGRIPEGATLSIGVLLRTDIEECAAQGMADLAKQINACPDKNYTYSTVLSVSCIGRYLAMLPDSGMEARILTKHLPQGMALAGFYSHGELGPFLLDDQKHINFAHNESLILCAF